MSENIKKYLENLPKLFTAVEIEINHHCNLSCSYCPNSIAQRQEKGLMSWELYQKIIQDLRQIDYSGRISYDFYNEPTLHPHLSSWVAYTKKQLPRSCIVLYSNGTRLDEMMFNELFESGVDHFIITQHEQTQGSEYAFQKTFHSLKDQDRKNVTYRPFHQINLYNRGGLLEHIGTKVKPLTPCYIPSFLLSITVKGKVLACFEDFHQHNIMGDVNVQTLQEIWHSPTFTQFRQNLRRGLRHSNPVCLKCNRLEVFPGNEGPLSH